MSIPAYTSQELNTRIAEGSVDLQRLAATVAGLLASLLELEASVTALANWANNQIQGAVETEAPRKSKR